jgi:hypothetical protein
MLDYYRAHTVAGGRLFYDHLKSQPVLVCIDDIKCHFAYTPQDVSGIDPPCVHVLPLDKVRNIVLC